MDNKDKTFEMYPSVEQSGYGEISLMELENTILKDKSIKLPIGWELTDEVISHIDNSPRLLSDEFCHTDNIDELELDDLYDVITDNLFVYIHNYKTQKGYSYPKYNNDGSYIKGSQDYFDKVEKE
jgi:hypothetical protein